MIGQTEITYRYRGYCIARESSGRWYFDMTGSGLPDRRGPGFTTPARAKAHIDGVWEALRNRNRAMEE
jgi:hypothetical protein